MKFGVFLNLWDSKILDEEKAEEIFKVVSEIGYDDIEILLNNPADIDSRLVKKLSKKFNMDITTTIALPAKANFMSEKEEEREYAENFLKNCIKINSSIGSSVLGGVIYAPWGKAITQNPKMLNFLVKDLRDISKYAKMFGVKLCIEPVNRFESNVVNTVDEGLSLIEKINSDNIFLLLDTFHMNIEEKDILLAIKKAGVKIGHFHTNENDRGIPGTGHIPWREIMLSLKEINYSGYLVFEAFRAPKKVLRAASIWRPIELIPDPNRASQESLNFLKSFL